MYRYFITIIFCFLIFISPALAGNNDDLESYNIGSSTDEIWGDYSGANTPARISNSGYDGNKGVEIVGTTTNSNFITEIPHSYENIDVQCIRLKTSNANNEIYFYQNKGDVNPKFGIAIDYDATSGFNEVTYYGHASENLLYLNDNVWIDLCVNFNKGLEKYNLCYKFPDEDEYQCANSQDYWLTATDIEYMRIGLRTATDPNRTFYYDDLYDGTIQDEDDEVEIIELPEQDISVSIGDEDYLTGHSQYCIINETCDLKITYSYEAVGDTAIIYESTILNTVGDIYATTSLSNNLLLKKEIRVATSSTEKTDYFCLGSENRMTQTCGIQIIWKNKEDLEYFQDTYDIESACDDMDQSASTTFMYGVECGLRKFGYWLFTPHTQTYMALTSEISEMKNNFPLSIYYDLRLMFETLRDFTVSPLEIPIIWYDKDGLHELDTLSVSSSTIISTDGMNETKYNMIYDGMELMVYLIGLFWLIKNIMDNTKKEKDE